MDADTVTVSKAQLTEAIARALDPYAFDDAQPEDDDRVSKADRRAHALRKATAVIAELEVTGCT